jgi:hypothetical protein
MKINFKKLAMSAGVTAAMAAGSMSAHAVITAVPAPAQLVPLFYYNTAGWDTDVRVTVPKAVGADSVIALLAGQRNGIDNIAVDTSWNTATGAFTPSIPGLLPSFNEIHWYWMDNQSKEIVNGTFLVTPDDTVWLSAAEVAADTGADVSTNGQAGYLILANASADGGGAPQFSFAADAWVENEGNTPGYPAAFSIPVLGLEDDVDSTTYPTPTNNLIQNYPTSAGGPIASPIQTGIRTSSTEASFQYRVVDLPIHDTEWQNNTVVAWNDRNGLSGRLYGIGDDEEYSSLGAFSLPNQLNIVNVGWTTANPANNVLGILNTCSGTCGARATSTQVNALNNIGEAREGGFLKFVIDDVALPKPATGTLANGAYSAMIMFNVPGTIDVNNSDEEPPIMAIDTGFFTQN